MSTGLACTRHPAAVDHRGYCAACLVEEALTHSPAVEPDAMAQAADRHLDGMGRFTIQMPLGESASASVFLVKSEGPLFRLLRLKAWKSPAPSGFRERFRELQARLEEWAEDGVPLPLAATVDETGCPSVLSEFRQGLPLLACVKSGRIEPEGVLERLTALEALTRRAHARALIHGSIVPGNVLLHVEQGAGYLLDFGLAPLVAPPRCGDYSASADLAGFAAIARLLAGSASGETGSRRL